ncbi:ArsR/SmtB family transcription factor [Radicibacter daui]|uniref:ArsR/SmtB family transcription factor n=1 Tax=Radicibacter daui TaxID=3064829 RepID=UPI004046EF34
MIDNGPYFAEIAALMGDPGRANMLTALMDGRARTAKELAFAAGVTPQTASGHLARLVEGGLLACVQQGRHRYFHLADPLVATTLETMMTLAGKVRAPAPRWHGPRIGADLHRARFCYDHLAGQLGVAIMDHLGHAGHLCTHGTGFGLSDSGEQFFAGLGIDAAAIARQKRCFARPCLDWSERRPHLAGGLAAALASRLADLGWLRRQREGRAVEITPMGQMELRRVFSFTIAEAA